MHKFLIGVKRAEPSAGVAPSTDVDSAENDTKTWGAAQSTKQRKVDGHTKIGQQTGARTNQNTGRKDVMLINELDRRQAMHAANKEQLGEWVQYGTIMYKLHKAKVTVASCVTDLESDSTINGSDHLSSLPGRSGVVGFDMDGTLISTASGENFALNENDWKWWGQAGRVIPELKRLYYEEHKHIVIISNQSGVQKKKVTIEQIQKQVDNMLRELERKAQVPVDFICAFHNDIFRKPRTGMWEFIFMARNFPLVAAAGSCVETPAAVDDAIVESAATTTTTTTTTLSAPPLTSFTSLYVGDAAGRPAEGKLFRKDFSDTDYKFALNLGISFSTPQQTFLKSRQRLHCVLPVPDAHRSRLLSAMQVFTSRGSQQSPASTSISTTMTCSPSFDGNLLKVPTQRTGNSTSGGGSIGTTSGTTCTAAHVAAEKASGAREPAATNTAVATGASSVDDGAENDIENDIEIDIENDIVLLVAPPACGKTTLSRRLEREGGYVRVNQDTLGSLERCLWVARDALTQPIAAAPPVAVAAVAMSPSTQPRPNTIINTSISTSSINTATTTTGSGTGDGGGSSRGALSSYRKKSVCVDNTNLDASARQKWIALGKELGVPVRCLVLERIPKELCTLLINYRLSSPLTPLEDRRQIDQFTVNTYYAKRDFPRLSEGFYRVDVVPWQPLLPEQLLVSSPPTTSSTSSAPTAYGAPTVIDTAVDNDGCEALTVQQRQAIRLWHMYLL